MPPPSPECRKKLQDVLTSSFDKKQLRQLAGLRLSFDDVRFEDSINFDEDDTQIAFQMVDLAVRCGHVEPLVRAVAAERPAVPDAQQLLVLFGVAGATAQAPNGIACLMASPGARPPQSVPPVLSEAVIRFNEQCQMRKQQIQYLNANKELHDLLHKLQNFQPRLAEFTVALRRASAVDERPDSTEVTDPLLIWVDEAKKNASATEVPDIASKWIARLEKAVGDLIGELTKVDVSQIAARTLDRALEVLANLPAQEQPRLNEKLVECAVRLKTDELIASIDRVLKVLDTAGSGSEELRGGFETFRSLCQQLTGMIRDHNLCQEVDGALREAAGLPEVSPQELAQWTEIRTNLAEILSHRPEDTRAKRPVESTKLFEEAAAAGDKKRMGQVFRRLVERFDDLFVHTDESLREMSRDLLNSVSLLDANLKRYI
jgi:hypothetical protein